MSPANANPSTYGYLEGRVVRLSPYPVSDERLFFILGNAQQARRIDELGPVFEVVVELDPAATPSGFAWTASSGPATPPSAGTPASIRIVTGSRSPIDYVFG